MLASLALPLSVFVAQTVQGLAPRLAQVVAALGAPGSAPSGGAASPAASAVDVPLSMWTSSNYPTGIQFGKAYGISCADYDADGWVDVFVCHSGGLWKNLGGQDWVKAVDLAPLLGTNFRYGAAFGDFNEDGLPDLATEPRLASASCMSLLEAGPNGVFRDIAKQAWRIDATVCVANTETNCWGDVDGDGWIDLFVPAYPPVMGSTGNWFFENLGPYTPSGKYAFTDKTVVAGLDNPLGAARPEGAQFADYDFDGDLDLYSNNTLYQNVSTWGTPSFVALAPAESGFDLFNKLEEGAAFADYDMDGDLDLLVAFTTAPGVVVYESRGDGTFFFEGGIVDSPMTGLTLGLSVEDWDFDGDLDFTTRGVFRRNRMIEDGARHFTVATHTINPNHLANATPAWFDWDRDGDLDTALGNWGNGGRLYQNDLYGPTTPSIDRRYVRVKPLKASSSVAQGLETEFGATVELTLQPDDGRRRVKFTSSSNGYLNQGEYTLTFGLPATPVDVVFDVAVDFPIVGTRGLWRVDASVNPVLGSLHLATLADRELQVFRDGRVRIGGVEYPALGSRAAWLGELGGGLALPAKGAPLAVPTATTQAETWAVLGVSTAGASGPIELRQLDLDLQLDAPVNCGGVDANVVLWDTTDPAQPFVANGGSAKLVTDPRNRRAHFRTGFVLQPNREYRLAARATSFRASPVNGPLAGGGLTLLGSALTVLSSPCSGVELANAPLDPHVLYLSTRFAP